MKKQKISTNNAPEAIGPYSQAVCAGGLLFVSGQIPIDPATGSLIDGDIAAQTERVLENIGNILKEGGAGFDNVVKTTIYLASLSDFAAVNEIYGRFFKKPYPARACVEVSALPKGARVEIEAVAII